MDEALRWATLAIFAIEQFDSASREEQLRTGKSAVELFDSAVARTAANKDTIARLREKLSATIDDK